MAGITVIKKSSNGGGKKKKLKWDEMSPDAQKKVQYLHQKKKEAKKEARGRPGMHDKEARQMHKQHKKYWKGQAKQYGKRIKSIRRGGALLPSQEK